jgi:two-component system, OmpR family, sensor kinase
MFDRLPIRVRLAGASALLSFVILCAFAVAVGSLTARRIRSDFNGEVLDTANEMATHLSIRVSPVPGNRSVTIEPSLAYFASPPDHAVVKIFALGGGVIAQEPANAPSLGEPNERPQTTNGYRVLSRPGVVRLAGSEQTIGQVIIQYGRRVAETEATVKRVELFLLLGVLVGSGMALLAGMMVARRAMAPIAELTTTAAEIARTRDPSRGVPKTMVDDEVAELAHTLEGMLSELDIARGETEAMLARQRQFVADASHELRTPLTSILANLELLAESLRDDQGEAARSALRSSQRMRRLVANLLLLARSDAGGVVPRESCNLALIVLDAAAELGPLSADRDVTLDVQQVVVEASSDDLHRLTLNLLENALRYTPPGSRIHVSTGVTSDGVAQLVVEDNGPGISPELASNLFERFVRGAGDRSGSFGLGLAIVQAVAQSHGGTVSFEPAEAHSLVGQAGGGVRFIVSLPQHGHIT